MKTEAYVPNGGQTYLPAQAVRSVPTVEHTPLGPARTDLPPLELAPGFAGRGLIMDPEHRHFLPGVTAEMMDWFWANMEKGYYLWAPGSHKRFNWVKAPWQYGFLNSAHMISETMGENRPVFGGSGVQINRLGLDYFPFTTALEHVIVEGVFNDLGEFVDMTVHMWDACPGGSRHITASVASTTTHEPPHFIKEMLAENPQALEQNAAPSDHSEYEASRWPQFLPQLYQLWLGHPDPSQNVPCNLEVVKTGEYTWAYTHENGPITLK